jgi:hypothetical protein
MSDSRYLSETDKQIVIAAREILGRGSQWCTHFMVADISVAELLSIGALRGEMRAASEAIGRALIAVEVNAEHWPVDALEPQSLPS